MEISCPSCNEGIASDGNPCGLCDGDGLVDLTNSKFAHYGNQWQLHGFVWDALLTRLIDIEDKVDAIAVQVQVLYDDLNP